MWASSPLQLTENFLVALTALPQQRNWGQSSSFRLLCAAFCHNWCIRVRLTRALRASTTATQLAQGWIAAEPLKYACWKVPNHWITTNPGLSNPNLSEATETGSHLLGSVASEGRTPECYPAYFLAPPWTVRSKSLCELSSRLQARQSVGEYWTLEVGSLTMTCPVVL